MGLKVWPNVLTTVAEQNEASYDQIIGSLGGRFMFFLSIIGIVGDLVESLIKRVSGVKDSGHILPGHGGLLDRCDSLLLTAPVMYYVLIWAHEYLLR